MTQIVDRQIIAREEFDRWFLLEEQENQQPCVTAEYSLDGMYFCGVPITPMESKIDQSINAFRRYVAAALNK